MRRNELAAEILKASISQSLPPMLQVELVTRNLCITDSFVEFNLNPVPFFYRAHQHVIDVDT
jgi:hypothetical protein